MINKRVLIRKSFHPYEEYEGIIKDKIIIEKSIINEVQAGPGYNKIEVRQWIPTTHYLIELNDKTTKIVKPDEIKKILTNE